MGETVEQEDLARFNQYETYPSFLIAATAFCTLTIIPVVLLPILYYRDVKTLEKMYDIDISSPKYLYYVFSPFLLHGLSILFYFRWRREKLCEAYDISESEVEEKEEQLDTPKIEPIQGALYVEALLLGAASIVVFFGLPRIIFYVLAGVLLLLGVFINPLLVYNDIKRLSQRNMGWESNRVKFVIAILSASVAFMLGYVIVRKFRVWTISFNSLRLEQRESEIGNLDSNEKQTKTTIHSTPKTKQEERTSSGSIFEQKKEN